MSIVLLAPALALEAGEVLYFILKIFSHFFHVNVKKKYFST